MKPATWSCGRFHFDFAKRYRPVVMGILNVTPDSFSDGGKFNTLQAAIDHAYQMIEDGAEIIDIGGESTRPGAEFVSTQEEQDRVLPILESLQSCGVALSLDSYKAQTMQAAAKCGVDILNDIRGFEARESQAVAKEYYRLGLCVMHMLKDPTTMQENIHYESVVDEVKSLLLERVTTLLDGGVVGDRICIDPGLGFAKTAEHNLTLLNRLDSLHALGFPILIGFSRKKTLGLILGSDTADRTHASVAAALMSAELGAQVIRVHDVKPTIDALKVWSAIKSERVN